MPSSAVTLGFLEDSARKSTPPDSKPPRAATSRLSSAQFKILFESGLMAMKTLHVHVRFSSVSARHGSRYTGASGPNLTPCTSTCNRWYKCDCTHWQHFAPSSPSTAPGQKRAWHQGLISSQRSGPTESGALPQVRLLSIVSSFQISTNVFHTVRGNSGSKGMPTVVTEVVVLPVERQ